jgi:hypothetical protein
MPKNKYYYRVISGIESSLNNQLERHLSEGWEIAGQASAHYHGTPTNAAYIYLPIRKKI